MNHPELISESFATAAEEWLAQTRQARVLHIFDRSCNLINEHRDVISINHTGVAKTPLAVTLANDQAIRLPATWHHVLNEQSQVTVQGQRKGLLLGELIITWDKAARWNASPDWASMRRSGLSRSESFDQLHRLLANESPHGSLAPLVSSAEDSSRLRDSHGGKSGIRDHLLAHAGTPARKLVRSLAITDLDAACRAAGALAGLGTGLTPSGDDFLMGTMHALWSLLAEEAAKRTCTLLLAAASPRTSALSSAWLKAASKGEAGEHWHGLADAIDHCDELALIRSTRRILRTGHTSGADALTGFLMTLGVWPTDAWPEPT